METAAFRRTAIVCLVVIAGLGVLWGLSRATARGAGRYATIDGRRYELQGAYSRKQEADTAARRVRAAWRKTGSRGSVRILQKMYRGVSPLWVVYTREPAKEV
jgi:hypothetical protein